MIESRKSIPKLYQKIIQKQLQMSVINKYRKKDAYLFKKKKKIIENLRLINGIITEYQK